MANIVDNNVGQHLSNPELSVDFIFELYYWPYSTWETVLLEKRFAASKLPWFVADTALNG